MTTKTQTPTVPEHGETVFIPLNKLKKHPTNWKELAKLDFNEAMDYVEEVSLTEEDEKDIVHSVKKIVGEKILIMSLSVQEQKKLCIMQF